MNGRISKTRSRRDDKKRSGTQGESIKLKSGVADFCGQVVNVSSRRAL
jgi:hypothetical protein